MTVENDPLIGQKFGKLKVVELSAFYVKPSDGKREKRYRCECECGGEAITSKRKLQTGHTNSCGCIRAKRQRRSKEEEYNTWNLMVQRCYNKNIEISEGYGSRGIFVCDRWLGELGYHNFIEDMGRRPSKKHTLERIDVNGSYCKENCIWTDDLSRQSYNQTIKSSNTSGKTGVIYRQGRNNPWCAIIRRNGVSRTKSFSSFEEAAACRDQWEIELYGFNKV